MFDKKRIGFFILFLLAFYSVGLPFSAFAAPAGKSAKADKAPKKEEGPIQGDPQQGKHLFKHYCAVCHGLTLKGNGINADNLDPHPANLTSKEVASLSDQEIFEVIQNGGAAVELSAYMPPWGKTLSREQIYNIISYIRFVSAGKPVETAEKGVRFSDIKQGGEADCQVCHVKRERLKPIAPNLGHEGSKFNREWLSKFIKAPGRIRPIGFIPLTKSKMPDFHFSDEEVASVTEFLMTLKDEGVSSNVLAGFDPSDPKEVEKGKRLFNDKFACDGCHKVAPEGSGGAVGPNLSSAAERLKPEWIFYWIKNPQAIRPTTPMPNFGAADDEIRSLIAYLSSLSPAAPKAAAAADAAPSPDRAARGEKIVKEKNCTGCHTIDRFNSQIKRQDKPKDSLAQNIKLSD
ncbi:MAG TPA: c-type cytochrome [Candidatus Manganitrophaceae bacterium]|nr:c-type cytochrome [Candidatus Manganitrophaceae bacterium]